MKYYEHAGIQIFHADCRDVLPMIRGVDLVVTDPPYGKRYHSGGIAQRASDKWRRPHEDKWADCRVIGDVYPETSALSLIAPIVVDGGAVYVFSQWMTEAVWCDALITAGLTVRNRLVWVKPFHGAGDLDTTFGPQHEAIFYATKGRHVLHGRRDGDVWTESVGRDGCFRQRLEHPNQKPFELLVWLIGKSSHQDDIVLDPYCGSGTTLVAAKQQGRRAIGIEIEERYCEIAARRLSQEVLPLGDIDSPAQSSEAPNLTGFDDV